MTTRKSIRSCDGFSVSVRQDRGGGDQYRHCYLCLREYTIYDAGVEYGLAVGTSSEAYRQRQLAGLVLNNANLIQSLLPYLKSNGFEFF